MSQILDFLERLLRQGEAVFHEPPFFPDAEKSNIEQLLESIYSNHRSSVAGAPLPFDREAAIAAAQLLSLACWILVSDDADSSNAVSLLQMPHSPDRPETHLSADLTLRLLDSVHRRVRIRQPSDPLVTAIVNVLRHWPLSGVIARIDEPPLRDLHFQNHYGVQLLYAERLSDNFRQSWVPVEGRTREVVELVLQQQGKSLPIPSDEESE